MKQKRFLKERIISALTQHVAPQQPAMWDSIGAQNEKSAGKSAFIAASRFGDSAKNTAEKMSQNIIANDAMVKFWLNAWCDVGPKSALIKPSIYTKQAATSSMNSMRSIGICLAVRHSRTAAGKHTLPRLNQKTRKSFIET